MAKKNCPANCDNGWVTISEELDCGHCLGYGRDPHGNKCRAGCNNGKIYRTKRVFCNRCGGKGTVNV